MPRPRGTSAHKDFTSFCVSTTFPSLAAAMARVALLACKRIVHERLHQLGRPGLMRVVALQAVGLLERLIPVSFDDRRIFQVVAVNAQRGSVLNQVIGEFTLGRIARLMRDMAGIASHVERRVPAASLGNVHAFVMTRQAEVFLLGFSGGSASTTGFCCPRRAGRGTSGNRAPPGDGPSL